MSTVARKKKIRNGHRLYAKKLISDATNSLDALKENPSNEEAGNKLKLSKVSLTGRLKTLDELDTDILSTIDVDEQVESEIFDTGKFKEVIQNILVQIDGVFESQMSNSSEISPSEPSLLSNMVNVSVSKTKVSCKLPKLSLKRFNGEPSLWTQFWDSFESAVDKNPELSEIDKFNYLRGQLEGRALATISGFSLTASNYNTTMKHLKDRFANPQIIISSHMEKLLKLQEVSDVNDIKKIQNLYDKVESNVRSLEAMNIKSDQYGSFLIPVVMSKMPKELQIIVSRKFDKNLWKFDSLLELFKEEIEVRERCSIVSHNDSKNDSRPRGFMPGTRNSYQFSAASLMGAGTKIICTYCRQNHISASCPIIPNPSAGKQFLKKNGHCFICLRRNHVARECTSTHHSESLSPNPSVTHHS